MLVTKPRQQSRIRDRRSTLGIRTVGIQKRCNLSGNARRLEARRCNEMRT